MGVSENIRRYREEFGMTQAQLADRLGVDRTSVTQWESGTSKPKFSNMSKLADIFGVDIQDIVSNVFHRTKPPSTALSIEEVVLLENYRALDDQGRKMAQDALRMWAVSARQAKNQEGEVSAS